MKHLSQFWCYEYYCNSTTKNTSMTGISTSAESIYWRALYEESVMLCVEFETALFVHKISQPTPRF